MNTFLTQAKELQSDIQSSIGAKANTGSINLDTNASNDSTKRILEDLEKNKKRDEEGEYESTKGLDNKMLIQKQKNMIERQDEQLDGISNVVDMIRVENQNFGQEAKLQNKMLDKVND